MIVGADAVGGVEFVTTVDDTVLVSAFISVIVATNVKKKRIVISSFTQHLHLFLACLNLEFGSFAALGNCFI